MDIDGLLKTLSDAGIEEFGIPVILETELKSRLNEIFHWALHGSPRSPRQVWFTAGNASQLRSSFSPELRCRILPVNPEQYMALLNRGPFEALLIPSHGFEYSDPNLTLNAFWKARGQYEEKTVNVAGHTLWFWKSVHPTIRLLGIDHHHAVLWDAKQILRPLGVKLDFVWLCDGRPSVNEAQPSQILPFKSSLDLYDRSLEEDLPSDFTGDTRYDGIITSHSLVTAAHLSKLGLPQIHINSTRFGNAWIHTPERHSNLVKLIQELLHNNKLHIVHNNYGDCMYFHQYFPQVAPHQEIVIPSLCESFHRIRTTMQKPLKFLIWDTRQVLLKNKSPFMRELYVKLKHRHGDSVQSQAILMAEKEAYLPEGYLEEYTAIIHIPYNISTMSIFQQTRANIPIWVPDKALLAKLWENPEEPNEMSWTVFVPGSESIASPLDNVRDPKVIQTWIEKADFYGQDMGNILTFKSSDDLNERLVTANYQALMSSAEEEQAERRQEIFSAWEQVIRFLQPPPAGGTTD